MTGTDIRLAMQYLRQGELVAIPTETVYGLAANALNEAAVLKIFQVKNRPAFDPLIVHTSDIARIRELVTEFPEQAALLADHFMPGPLTLLLPKKNRIPDLVTSGLDTVAVRIPDHPLTSKLLASLDFPLAAPSANPFGYISPTTAAHVEQQLGCKIPYILDGGPCHVGLESTIAGFENGHVVIYRKGGIPIEAIEAITGPVVVREHSTSNPRAPGMLKSHYAPRIPLIIGNIEALLEENPLLEAGVLSFQTHYPGVAPQFQQVLSETGSLEEAARHLFGALRYLDQQPLDVIYAELFPEEGLGRAINDRLRRASVLTVE